MTRVKDYSRGVRVLRIICDIVFVLGLFLSWVFSLNLMRELWYVFGLAGLGAVLFHTGPESDVALGIVQCVYAVGRFFLLDRSWG